ncbi:MAG: cobalamin B12-binding domain-containing protein, partial [Armatimonadetes bacterium]|nr:cobalamin B12-binding domain-containing protein [Armatimonadota bacterium]
MADILLATLNARYAHTSFSLRYLKANLGALEGRAEILERTIQDRPVDVVERILEKDPRIVGLSVYIWNAAPMLEIVRLLKRVSPETVVVLGGPEVSYEVEPQELCRHADYVVTHEGERAFRELCEAVLEGRPTGGPILAGGRLAPESLRLPYRLYSDEDLRHRTLYVEASRGCPFRCQFCLSSLDESVRHLPLDPLLSELELLLARGARHFKFIDRTFNLRLEVSRRILDFFLERYQPGLFLHFEMIPDRFPESLRPLLRRFPAGALQLEVGIQTFDPEVASRIERRQNYRKL